MSAAIEAARARPFEYGTQDCALFAASVVEAITGVDVAAVWRGYAGERAALKIVRDAGGLAKLASHALGETIRPTFARRGDVVLIERPEPWGAALGVCVGTHAAFAGATGLWFEPMPEWRCAWRVGWCPR